MLISILKQMLGKVCSTNKGIYESEENCLEVNKIIKDSNIEEEIKYYLNKNNIPDHLRNDARFIELVIDKLYLENDIYNLREDINGDYFDGVSPDECDEFYSQAKEDRDRQIKEYNKEIDEKKVKYIKAIDVMALIDKKLDVKL